jgi:DNA-binding MarR family transcriptional regulator
VNYTAQQFIAMPDFLNLKQQKLKYLDALTYVSIRSFDSNEKEYCYPSYTKIMERSGLGRTFLAASINRLEDAGFLKIVRSKGEGTCNKYYFGDLEHYEQFSYDILFKTEDLSNHEKAMLICLRQFFVHGGLSCIFKIRQLANLLGVSYRQVHNPLSNLIKEEYIREVCKPHKHTNKALKYYKITDKINWPLIKNTVTAHVYEMPKVK